MTDRAWLRGLPGTENWRKILPVRGGWGSDEKYEIYTHTGEHLFLRAASDAYTKQKYGEFAFAQRCQGIGFMTPKTIACGMHHGRVYQILSWIEGEPLSQEIIGMPESEQYRFGQEAGRALAAIHSVMLEPSELGEVDGLVERRKRTILNYMSSKHRMAGDDSVLIFVAKHVTQPKRIVGLHGDFHIGNLLLTPEGNLAVIDFDRRCVGDRWQDFQRAQAFSVPHSTAFVNGQLHGYFRGNPPDTFWESFAYEAAYGAVEQILWAIPFGESMIQQMQMSYVRAMRDFRGFLPCEPPAWYEPV